MDIRSVGAACTLVATAEHCRSVTRNRDSIMFHLRAACSDGALYTHVYSREEELRLYVKVKTLRLDSMIMKII